MGIYVIFLAVCNIKIFLIIMLFLNCISISFILTMGFYYSLFRFIFLADAFSEGLIENAYIYKVATTRTGSKGCKSSAKFRPPVPGIITRS